MLRGIVGVATASALSGITFLSYEHHAAYERLVWPLAVIVLFVVMMVLTWNIAVERTRDELALNKKNDNLSTRELSKNLMVPWWVLYLAILTGLYVVLLLWLPVILRG